MMKQTKLGEFEELVLMAILKVGDSAYGISIASEIEKATRRNVAIGALYTTLGRLESKGLLTSRIGDPINERGGRARKYYKIEAIGISALNESDRRRRSLIPVPV